MTKKTARESAEDKWFEELLAAEEKCQGAFVCSIKRNHNTTKIDKAINKIGENLVRCDLKCEGINNNPKRGVIPRCLIQEKRNGKKKCIVVGLNPGKCNAKERKYYLNNGISFVSLAGYFDQIQNRRYFKEARELITLLGFDGDILWTDLAECECLGKNGEIPIQTLRVCINRFLRKEIDLFKHSTIFALGNVAFNFCALSFPNHFIVGLPHSSGSYGTFSKLKKKVQANKRHFIKCISKAKDHNKYRAVHLAKIDWK